MRTVAFCEIDPYCRKVLAKHWPGVPCYPDVRELSANRLGADGIRPDVICGGFPCQDISQAGKRAGIEGERSGLWKEYARIIGEIRPRYVIVENVSALLGRGLDVVLGDLAALGYDAEWHCIPAAAVGAPHIRDRVWILAYPQHSDADDAGPYRAGLHEQGSPKLRHKQIGVAGPLREDVADAYSGDGYRRGRPLQMGWGRFAREIAADGDAGRTQWGSEPELGRVAHGVPDRVDRLKALGNAVVPQIPEIIGRAIMRTVSLPQAQGKT